MQTQMRLLPKKQSDQFPVRYSNKHFVNFSPDRQHFIGEQREKSVQCFRTFTVSTYIQYLFLASIQTFKSWASLNHENILVETHC